MSAHLQCERSHSRSWGNCIVTPLISHTPTDVKAGKIESHLFLRTLVTSVRLMLFAQRPARLALPSVICILKDAAGPAATASLGIVAVCWSYNSVVIHAARQGWLYCALCYRGHNRLPASLSVRGSVCCSLSVASTRGKAWLHPFVCYWISCWEQEHRDVSQSKDRKMDKICPAQLAFAWGAADLWVWQF